MTTNFSEMNSRVRDGLQPPPDIHDLAETMTKDLRQEGPGLSYIDPILIVELLIIIIPIIAECYKKLVPSEMAAELRCEGSNRVVRWWKRITLNSRLTKLVHDHYDGPSEGIPNLILYLETCSWQVSDTLVANTLSRFPQK